MSASEDYRPKIVRWGKKHGGTNAKWGNFIQAQQWGGGSTSNSHTPSRSGGKTYKNTKLHRLSVMNNKRAQQKGTKKLFSER